MRLKVWLAASAFTALVVPMLAQSPRVRLRQQLETPYQRWLDEEVRWIIANEERAAFSGLQTDEERLEYIESFWLRRDPTPGTEANEFRSEHYRRIAWANDRFANAIPGWRTDRGAVYIRFGAPDEREERQAGGAIAVSYDRWLYRSLEGFGQNVIFEFTDPAGNNEYRLDPAMLDRLVPAPGGVRVR